MPFFGIDYLSRRYEFGESSISSDKWNHNARERERMKKHMMDCDQICERTHHRHSVFFLPSVSGCGCDDRAKVFATSSIFKAMQL